MVLRTLSPTMSAFELKLLKSLAMTDPAPPSPSQVLRSAFHTLSLPLSSLLALAL